MRTPAGTPLSPLSSRMSSGRISPRWLILVRSIWVVCALLLLANFVASIPASYQLLRTVCTLPDPSNCTTGQLTPNTVQTLAHLHLSLSSYAAFFVILDVAFSLLPWGIGLLLFWRKPDERMSLFVSLLLVLFGGTGSINSLLGIWAGTQPSPLLVTLFSLISGAEWIGLGAFLLTFPTGRFAPRWSWLILSCWIITFVWNSPPPPQGQFQVLLVLLVVIPLIASLAVYGGTLFIMVYRYVRVFDATQRQQAKWVIYATAVSLSLLSLGTILPNVVPAKSPSQLLFPTIVLFSSALFYLGLGLAILRYRLWDIDAIINRTLVYGSLTTLLALIYVGLIVVLQALFQGVFNQNSDVAIVVSTLVIAALFQPLRHHLQQIINRRFYRRNYNAARTLATFSETLRQEVNLATLSEHLVGVVQETMQPASVSLWLRTPVRQQDKWRATPSVHSEREARNEK